MKTKTFPSLLLFLCIIALGLQSCKKDKPATRTVEFTSTNYLTLGSYNSVGKPDYLLSPGDTISPAMIGFINTTLPEGQDLRKTHPGFLTTEGIADISITQQSDVFITFVSHTGGYTNTFAFYTYPSSQPPTSTKDIKTITYVFPNSGALTPLHPGDKVKLGRFDVGTSIGFVLLQKAWDTTTNVLNNKVVHFCSNDVLNPEVDPNLQKHAVLIKYEPENKILIGFEDLDRTGKYCDHDFNDLVVYCTVKP